VELKTRIALTNKQNMNDDNITRIKDCLSIVDVVGSYLKLEKAGINFKARCPFHNEKTPSFFISPDRGTYKCFGCGAGGDMFTFVEQFEGIKFYDSLKLLAKKAGVELKNEDTKSGDDKKKIYEVMEASVSFFENGLNGSNEVLKYLEKRGVEKKTLKEFRIGFAENKWDNLFNFLKEKGWSDEEIEKAGLIKKGERGNFYDRFRGRIMFPLFDSLGKTIAFSGRLFDDCYDDSTDVAKYLNSPETVLFNKSKVLYGYNFAKNDIRKRDFSILVEGQMDLVMAHQAGFTNTVATSGTALTEDHLTLLKRISNNIIMAFDGDEAGLRATNKSAKTALNLGMEVKLLEIPEGLDPADFILKDKNGWAMALKNSVSIIDFNLNYLSKKFTDKRKLGLKVAEIVLPLIDSLKNKIEQAHYVSKVSQKTEVNEDIIWEELNKVIQQGEVLNISDFSRPNDEKEMLSTKQKIIRGISSIIYWQESSKKPIIDIDKNKEVLKNKVGQDFFDKIQNLSETRKEELIFEAENLYFGNANLESKLEELFISLDKEYLVEERNLIQQKIKVGENEEKNLKIYNDLSKKIEDTDNKLKNKVQN